MRRLVIGLCIVWLGIGGAVAQGPPPLPEPIPLETFGTAWDMAWRPQHDTLAVATRDTVWLLDEQLQVLDKLPMDVIAFDIEWSPDGKWLMVRHEQALEIWDVDNHAHVLSIPHYPASEEVLQTITWSPDSRWLAVAQSRDDSAASYVGQIPTIEVWDIAAGQMADAWVVDYQPRGLVWHPHNGHQLAVVHGQVDIVDPTTWAIEQTLVGAAVSYPVTWSPDGTMLAAQAGDVVLVWNVHEPQPRQRLPTYHRYVSELTWGTGGLMVVDGSSKGVVWNTDTWTIQDVYTVHTRMAWHPDGQRLVAASTILELWDTTHHRRLASNWRFAPPPMGY